MVCKKVLIIGDTGCGKTSLIIAFFKKIFPKLHIPKLIQQIVEDITIDGKTHQLDLWDTGGICDEYTRSIYKSTDVILLCFAIDDALSLENIQNKWIPEIKKEIPNTPFILVGNKSDLRNFDSKFATETASNINAIAYLECSAKTNEGVYEVFEAAARAALNKKKKCVLL